MEDEAILVVLAVLVGVCILYGLFTWKKLRARWSNVIGVGGAYIILLGWMLLVLVIGRLIGGAGINGEAIMLIVVMAACMVYFVLKELKLPTVRQKLLFPFAAISIAGAFIWKLIFGIVFRGGLGGTPEGELPTIVYDEQNNQWNCLRRNDGEAEYQSKDGRTVHIYHTEISGTTANTSAGVFHWY